MTLLVLPILYFIPGPMAGSYENALDAFVQVRFCTISSHLKQPLTTFTPTGDQQFTIGSRLLRSHRVCRGLQLLRPQCHQKTLRRSSSINGCLQNHNYIHSCVDIVLFWSATIRRRVEQLELCANFGFRCGRRRDTSLLRYASFQTPL